jgi:hypothetical protein
MQRSRTWNTRRFLLALSLILGLATCGAPEAVETTAPPGSTASPAPKATATSGVLESPLPTPTSPPSTPASGFGGARGIIASRPVEWEGQELTVFFAPFVGDENDEGIFVLEPSIHPSKPVAPDGTFYLDNIPPGKYVVVVGPGAEGAVAVSENGRPRIFEVEEGQILDLEAIDL